MFSGRKDCRSGEQPCTPRTEAEALYCQGSHAALTRTEIAETMGVNPSTLGNWLDPHHASRIPDERREELLKLTSDHLAYISYLALLQGVVVYDPKATRGRNVTRMVTEFGDLLKAIDQRRDGTTAAEAIRIRREADDLIAAVDCEARDACLEAGLSDTWQEAHR